MTNKPLTVEEAMAQLKEIFPGEAISIAYPTCIVYLYEHDASFQGDSVDEVMAQVRAWKESQ